MQHLYDRMEPNLIASWEAYTGPMNRVKLTDYEGERANLRVLFELAEDSQEALDSYISSGRVLVATLGREIVGHLQLTPRPRPAELEIKNMAVLPSHQRRGIGRMLLERATEVAREEGRSRLFVATATADVGNLRFYQRAGFRFASIDRDAFTPAHGYPRGLVSDGIALCDRVWLVRELADGGGGDGWPAGLPVRQVRIARPTEQLDEVVRFYRDTLGLEELGRFADHDGYSGVMLGLPGADYHLEFTTHALGSPGDAPTRDNLLVLYVASAAAVRAAVDRLAPASNRSRRRIRTGRLTAASPSRIRMAGGSS
jgi:GNAT superfamily N-acetyltransferase/catechol 2,3-dioxygenase-like lactoylglutathione lyase family enzyme